MTLSGVGLITSPKEVMFSLASASVNLFVWLLVSRIIAGKKLIKRFTTKFGGKAAYWPRNKWLSLHFGGNLDVDPVPGMF